jgi:fatty-acyl-CoA synthase
VDTSTADTGPKPNLADAVTIAALVAARAEDDNIALIFGAERWTWREVVSEASRRAAWLKATLDPDKPPHVGVLLPNTPDYVVTLFGAALAGACIVGINATRRGAELVRDVKHTECQFVLSDDAGSKILPGVTRVEDEPWKDFPDTLPTDLPGSDALLVLIFTSGSTSAPKAVRRSSGRVAKTVQLGFTSDDVLYCVMPLAHGNALFSNVYPGLAAGASLVLRERFSATQWINDVRTHRVTFANMVGRALGYVLATPAIETDRDHRLRVVLAPEASPRDAATFEKRFGTHVISGYGQSEGGIHLLPSRREGALGRAPNGSDIAVVNPDTALECATADLDANGLLRNPHAAVGELVRRDAVGGFEGYWANPEAEGDRTRNGWYWSGDLAYRDATGVFFFGGRVGDWLRVDAENFSAAPIERVLSRHPEFAAVAVVGVPDPQSGDQVLAAVELTPGASFDAAAFPGWLAEQADLGVKWVPRFVRVCAHLPQTGNDKVDRRAVKEQAWITNDPVWWRPGREATYRLLSEDDRTALREEFGQHGRTGRFPGEVHGL